MVALNTAQAATDTVVLLHGLARGAGSMNTLEKALNKGGYKVHNLGYPSTAYPIEYLATEWLPAELDKCCGETKVHFVTHSMGGIILRYYAKHVAPERIQRAVMLGPPNQGSEIVDQLGDIGLFEWINGVAGTQLGTGPQSIPNQLGAVNFDTGIIAGDRSVNPILSTLIPGPDDGKVSVSRTKVQGMRDFIVMHHTHTFMMSAKPVIEQTMYFLKFGRFKQQQEQWI